MRSDPDLGSSHGDWTGRRQPGVRFRRRIDGGSDDQRPRQIAARGLLFVHRAPGAVARRVVRGADNLRSESRVVATQTRT